LLTTIIALVIAVIIIVPNAVLVRVIGLRRRAVLAILPIAVGNGDMV